MNAIEKAAYLRGLCDGLGYTPDTKEGKLWGALCELVSDMAHQIDELQQSDEDFADALNEMGEELSYLEELTCDLDTPEDRMDDGDGEYGDCLGDCGSCTGCDFSKYEEEGFDGIFDGEIDDDDMEIDDGDDDGGEDDDDGELSEEDYDEDL